MTRSGSVPAFKKRGQELAADVAGRGGENNQ